MEEVVGELPLDEDIVAALLWRHGPKGEALAVYRKIHLYDVEIPGRPGAFEERYWSPVNTPVVGPDGQVIPDNVLTRAPTAELRENQTDQDSLPPYEVLDGILERLVEREEPIAKIVEAGFDRATVVKVERLLNLAEYKRRQAAPGVKVTTRNFGRDRRYPITNRFRDNGKALPTPDEKLVARAGRASADVFDG